ncbi:MAG: hypothetical protein NTZ61_09415, partial [Proteobacteria bacterium]|nr:hypothetical protein [Pseudomonadota bacterium]
PAVDDHTRRALRGGVLMSGNELPRLSKSSFLKGLQCPKLLWWSVREPDAPELVPDESQQRVFARGTRVGELAQRHVPGGVLIDLPYMQIRERVAATAAALAAGAPAIYEASFLEDGVFVSVDILERSGDGFVLTEVKSTLDVKEQHLADVAIQLHVVRRAGLPVHRAEVMHLNRACRFPDLSNLFVRAPVTEKLHDLLLDAPAQIAALRGMLAGAIPEVATGPHCKAPYECPFLGRCWPPLPDHHVSTLYRLQPAKFEALLAQGCVTIQDLPSDFRASAPAMRQVRSVRAGAPIVEHGSRSNSAATSATATARSSITPGSPTAPPIRVARSPRRCSWPAPARRPWSRTTPPSRSAASTCSRISCQTWHRRCAISPRASRISSRSFAITCTTRSSAAASD